jgi:hypothetical protein
VTTHVCCCGGAICTNCEPQAIPNSITILLALIVNGTCTNCDEINDTYNLPYRGYCHWEDEFDLPSKCDGESAYVLIQADLRVFGAGYQLWVTVEIYLETSSSFVADFRKDFEAKPDCNAWNGLDVPLYSGYDVHCDGTAATCAVTL